MLTAILGLFGSSAMGSLIGWIGGAANRWIDLKNRDKDLEVAKLNNAHELAKLAAEREFMQAEAASKLQIVQTEGENAAVVADIQAMAASYENDKATYGIVWIDAIRGVIRPILTLLFFLFSVVIFCIVASYVYEKGVPFSADQLHELFMKLLEWVLFQAGVCIGWWFASRGTPIRKEA